MFDFETFTNDHGIETTTEGKHATSGWINTRCFCSPNSNGHHLGFNGVNFSCYKCGTHSALSVVKELTGVSWDQAKALIEQYKLRPKENYLHRYKNKKVKEVKLPLGCDDINNKHRKYLLNRNFDPDKLVREWDIQGTSNIGDYKFRIIVPIMYKKNLVSFQGRDITNKNINKYKACSRDKELIEHQQILYGLDNVVKDSVIVVEGIFDVFRLGYGAVSTFGASYTWSQVLLLNRFKNVFIFFDSDQAGIDQGKKLAALLSGIDSTKHIEIISVDSGDPGDLSDTEASDLMRDLKLK